MSLIKSNVKYEDLTVGDRNALLIAARILSYGKDYSFRYTNPNTNEDEEVTVDLQNVKYREVDWSLFDNNNESSSSFATSYESGFAMFYCYL